MTTTALSPLESTPPFIATTIAKALGYMGFHEATQGGAISIHLQQIRQGSLRVHRRQSTRKGSRDLPFRHHRESQSIGQGSPRRDHRCRASARDGIGCSRRGLEMAASQNTPDSWVSPPFGEREVKAMSTVFRGPRRNNYGFERCRRVPPYGSGIGRPTSSQAAMTMRPSSMRSRPKPSGRSNMCHIGGSPFWRDGHCKVWA